MKKIFGIFLVGLLFTGCATQQGFRDEMQSYVGGNIMDVYNVYGPPSYTRDYPNGQQAHVWVHQGATVVAPVGSAYMAVQRSCTFTFVTGQQDLWVSDVRWRGRGCTR